MAPENGDEVKVKLTQTDLSKALGVSLSRVVAMRKQGMPVDSIAAAKAWRKTRIKHYTKPSEPEEAVDPDRELDYVDAIENIAYHAAARGMDDSFIDLLLSMILAMSDDQLRRLRSRRGIPPVFWRAIESGFAPNVWAWIEADGRLPLSHFLEAEQGQPC